MDSFEVIQPSARLRPYVRNYWFLTCGFSIEPQRIIPTGSVSLVFHRAGRMFSTDENAFQPSAFLCGQSSGFGELQPSGVVDMIHVTFQPYGAKAFFGLPLHDIRDLTVSVDALADRRLRELEETLFETPDNRASARAIEAYLLDRLRLSKEYNFNRMHAVVRAIDAGEGDMNRLAGLSCLGYKQFKRIFSEYVGANPKDFLRVIRFHRALHIRQHHPDIPLAQLALESGYYDQAHLTRDFKVFSGYSPTEYFSMCEPYSDYFG